MCFDMFRAPLFDRTHILSGVPVDTFIELRLGCYLRQKVPIMLTMLKLTMRILKNRENVIITLKI